MTSERILRHRREKAEVVMARWRKGYPRIFEASLAKYVRRIDAPGPRIEVSESIITRSWSIQFPYVQLTVYPDCGHESPFQLPDPFLLHARRGFGGRTAGILGLSE
jgi:hypothetical protein